VGKQLCTCIRVLWITWHFHRLVEV